MRADILVTEWFDEKFRVADLSIARSGSWLISLRPAQVTLGALVLSLARPCETLAAVSADETADLSGAFSLIQRLCDATFRPDKLNYLALMMVDPQVHFHVIPRYASSVTHAGVEFVDAGWPGPPVLDAPAISADVERQILAVLFAAGRDLGAA